MQMSKITGTVFKIEAGNLVLMVAKIVGDLKIAGRGTNAQQFLDKFHINLNLGAIKKGPGSLRSFCFNISQNEDM